MKAYDETEDEIQTVTLSKKQYIDKVFFKRIDKFQLECTFIDQNDNEIVRLPCHQPQQKDQFGRYREDSDRFKILDGNIFMY
jgi:hypothetical protein